MEVSFRDYVGTGAGMKTSIYINKENEERLKALLQGDKGLSASGVINDALELYFDAVKFDDANMRKRRNYGLVVFRVHKVVIRLLTALKRNFSIMAVNELVMFLILKEFQAQSGRKHFPDRIYTGIEYINKLIKILEKKADLFKI